MSDFAKSDNHKNITAAKSLTPLPKMEKKRPRVGSNVCPKCEITLTDITIAVACSICELSFCLECSKVPKQIALALAEEPCTNFMWTCNSCKIKFPSLSGVSAQLKSIEVTTNQRITKLEDEVKGIKTDMSTNIQNERDQTGG